MQWSLVAGRIPPGMTGPHLQGVGSGFVTGRPTTIGTFQFTIRGRDNIGQTDTAVFTINVVAARPVTITTEGFFSSPPGPRVGESPCCWNLFSDGGTPGYTYAVVAGALPTGTSIVRFSNGTRISGTLRAAGTFTFSLVSTDSRGSRSAPKQFTIVVNP
jgi:large repetitive protein